MTQHTAKSTGTQIQIKRILAPTDFSPLGNRAVEVAGEFARRYDAELTIMHVMAPFFGGTEADVLAVPAAYYGKDILAMLQERLDDLTDKLRAENTRVKAVISMGVPFMEIIKNAREQEVDMIVISTHGRTGISHALIGSTAERVVRKAPCPVLSMRPTDLEEEG